MKKKQTVELLKKIYENSKTGMETADMLMVKTRSPDFEKILKDSRERYYEIAAEADSQLSQLHELPPENGFFGRLGMWSAVQMSMAKRPDRMAEVVINGCTEGIIDITRVKNNAVQADEKAVALADRLTRTEQDNISVMEKYL